MNITITLAPTASSTGLLDQPILLAAVITFFGVLLTVIVGTIANFRLARRRNEFEQTLARDRLDAERQLAQDKLTAERDLATQKLENETTARRETRQLTTRLRHIEFQRATLLELQECMHSLYRAAFRQTDPTPPPGVDWVEQQRAGNAKSSWLISRVHNEKIRTLAQALKGTCNSFADPRSESARTIMTGSLDEWRNFNEATGAAIRELDREEEAEFA